MSDTDRIARLEQVLGTLITWLNGFGLRQDEVETLLKSLNVGIQPARPED